MYRVRTQSARTQRGGSLIVTAILACAGIYAYRTQQLLFYPVAIVAISFAFVSFWDWMVGRAVTYKLALDKPEKPSEELTMLEIISRLTDNQIWLAAYAMGFTPGEPEIPQEPEIVPGVTKSYAISKLDRAVKNNNYLEPLRSTSEGTPERRQYAMFLEWAVSNGLAKPAAGNKPPQVTDYKKARERILE